MHRHPKLPKELEKLLVRRHFIVLAVAPSILQFGIFWGWVMCWGHGTQWLEGTQFDIMADLAEMGTFGFIVAFLMGPVFGMTLGSLAWWMWYHTALRRYSERIIRDQLCWWCEYELGSLASDGDGPPLCPECGRQPPELDREPFAARASRGRARPSQPDGDSEHRASRAP